MCLERLEYVVYRESCVQREMWLERIVYRESHGYICVTESCAYKKFKESCV